MMKPLTPPVTQVTATCLLHFQTYFSEVTLSDATQKWPLLKFFSKDGIYSELHLTPQRKTPPKMLLLNFLLQISTSYSSSPLPIPLP